MKNRLPLNLSILLISLLVGFLICEGITRLITSSDADGQVYLRGRSLLPYRFPARMVQQKLDHFFRNRSKAYVIEDPVFGWTIAPGGRSENGLYRANSRGIRSRPREYSLRPDPGVVRIALFGDSFTHGDEEPYYKTWGKFLEDDLKEDGVAAEVINFGVPGFGIGQAYLRWKLLGREYLPRIVVFGFQAENMNRTVNIFRQLYSRRTWLVFTKPRFIIAENGELELINSPVIPPDEISEVLRNLPDSPLARHEYWYNPDNYSTSPWFKSRFITLLYDQLHRAHPDHKEEGEVWEPAGEAMRVTLAILRQFARQAEEEGSIFIILHIPKASHLKVLKKGVTPPYYYIFRELEKEGVTVVDPAPQMMGKHHLYKHSHFSSKGGRIVARALAEAVNAILKKDKEANEISIQ